MEVKDYETREEITKKIIDLENRYYKLYKLNIKFKELFSKRLKHEKELSFVRKQIRELNKKLTEYSDEEENKLRNPLSNGQIIKIDYKYKVKSYELFNMLDIETDFKKRIHIISKLKHIYSELLKDIDKKDKQNIRKVLQYLNEILKKEQHKLDNNLNKIKIEPITINKTTKNEEDDINELICEDILIGKGISMYSLLDILEAFKYILKNKEINSNLIKCAKEITNRLILESKEDEFYINYIYSIIDAAKLRKNEFSKIDEEKYKILKDIIKILKNHQELITNNEKSSRHDLSMKYKFDIVQTLLSDENNFLVIKQLLIKYPDIVNSMKDGKHIIEYILELYLLNLEKLLNKNRKNYTNVEFLKEVYYLFAKNRALHINDDIKDRINKQTYLFIRRLTNDSLVKQVYIDDDFYDSIFIKKDKKKKNITRMVKKLSSHYFDDNNITYELRSLNEAQFENQINYVSRSDSNYRNRRDEIDLTNEDHIILNNKYTVYNFKRCSDSNILKISVCDFSNLIPSDTSIDSYIYNELLEKNRLDQRILDKLKFEDGKKVSAITFKISFDKTNRPISLYIYKSKIIPKKIDSSTDMYNDMKNMIQGLIKRKNYDCTLDDKQNIEMISRKVLNELYLELAKKEKIPYTYSGVGKKSIEPNLYSSIGSITSKLSNNEFTSIYNTIINNVGFFHYSDRDFETDGEFDLNLVGEPNYILLLNQRIIKSLLLNELNLSDREYAKRKYVLSNENQNMIIDLNNSIDYKDTDDFKNDKKKKKILIPTGY